MKTSENFRYYEKLIAALHLLQQEKSRVVYHAKPGAWAHINSNISNYSKHSAGPSGSVDENAVFFVPSI